MPNINRLFGTIQQGDSTVFIIRPAGLRARVGYRVSETEFDIFRALYPFFMLMQFIMVSLMGILMVAANIFGLMWQHLERNGPVVGPLIFYGSVLFYIVILLLTGLLPKLFFVVVLSDKPKISLDDVEVIAAG